MKHSLTIVLPIHNGEAQLRGQLDEVLELAGELTDCFSVLIVDDGSSDDTYEVASELATRFPQVQVIRNHTRRGLGAALESLRPRVKSDVVVVHDGVTPLDTNQVRRLWQQCTERAVTDRQLLGNSAGTGAHDLVGISSMHAAMEQAHQRVAGFELLQTPGRHASAEGDDATEAPLRESNRSVQSAVDVGRIPTLPRPNFLEVIADFAMGE